MKLKQGDIIILETDDTIPDTAHKRITNEMLYHFPGHKCLILEKMKIGVIREK